LDQINSSSLLKFKFQFQFWARPTRHPHSLSPLHTLAHPSAPHPHSPEHCLVSLGSDPYLFLTPLVRRWLNHYRACSAALTAPLVSCATPLSQCHYRALIPMPAPFKIKSSHTHRLHFSSPSAREAFISQSAIVADASSTVTTPSITSPHAAKPSNWCALAPCVSQEAPHPHHRHNMLPLQSFGDHRPPTIFLQFLVVSHSPHCPGAVGADWSHRRSP
jgi:hypothetical protein